MGAALYRVKFASGFVWAASYIVGWGETSKGLTQRSAHQNGSNSRNNSGSHWVSPVYHTRHFPGTDMHTPEREKAGGSESGEDETHSKELGE